MHDGVRYDWEKGDAVAVHNDSVHWDNNEDPDRGVVILVMKAKPLWLFLGLHQQGPLGTSASPDDDRCEPSIEWRVIRDPEDLRLKKIIKPNDTPWQTSPHGRVRLLADPSVPLRVKAIDLHLQEIAPGSRSAGSGRSPMRSSTCSKAGAMIFTGTWKSKLPTSITPASPKSRAAGNGRLETWCVFRTIRSTSISTPIRPIRSA
jgi:hypothetical protein